MSRNINKKMSKIFNYYSDKIDRTWYNSSNIVYSECIDHDDALKTLKVVFANGTQYAYYDVDVNQYLLFREDESQGKALNRIIKGGNYKYEKLENANLEAINEEYMLRSGGGFLISNNDDGFTIRTTKDEVVYKEENKKYDETMLKTVTDILTSVGVKFKLT